MKTILLFAFIIFQATICLGQNLNISWSAPSGIYEISNRSSKLIANVNYKTLFSKDMDTGQISLNEIVYKVNLANKPYCTVHLIEKRESIQITTTYQDETFQRISLPKNQFKRNGDWIMYHDVGDYKQNMLWLVEDSFWVIMNIPITYQNKSLTLHLKQETM